MTHMNPRNLRSGLGLVALVIGSMLPLCAGAAAEEGCVTDKCHAKLLTGETVHPVAASCEICHQPVDTPHPQKGKKTFKLTQEPPELCTTCHAAIADKSHVHFPVAQGMCTTCHNPHASRQPHLLTQPLKELCGTCHADHLTFKVTHGPVSAGACTACHTPHSSDNQKLLLKQGEALCFDCHVDMQEVLKKKNVHPALGAGCTACHNPHGSDFPNLLSGKGQDVCFLCHPQIAEKVKNAVTPHPALMTEKACAACHLPHASDYEQLLLSPEKDLCITCHDSVIPRNATVLHGPDNDGKCSRCHDPHGSQNDNLLVKEFPGDIYVPYTDTAYGLCFSCHKRDMVQYPETSFATNFRDGERNLHYVHVHNPKMGRSCILCHSLHGSPNPMLIADTVPFGKWQLPLRFVKTETGGGCSPGCHKPQFYDRKTPGKKP